MKAPFGFTTHRASGDCRVPLGARRQVPCPDFGRLRTGLAGEFEPITPSEALVAVM